MKNIFNHIFKPSNRILIHTSLSLIIIFGLSVPIQAQSTLILNDKQSKYPLGMYLEILEDPTTELSIDDVISTEYRNLFIPNQKKVPNFGYTNSAYWVRFRCRNEASATIDRWRLELGFSNMHYVDFYKPSSDGKGFDVIQTGNRRPVKSRDVDFYHFVFKLSFQDQTEQTFYLRFKNGASMTLPLTLWPMHAFYQKRLTEQFRLGILIGILLIMVGYNLFIFLSLRDKSYLYCTITIFFALMFILSFTGLAYQYLWPNLIWWNHITVPLFNGLLIIAFLKFTDTFLNMKMQLPKLHQLTKIFLAILCIQIILIPFISYRFVIQPIILIQMFGLFMMILAGFLSLRQGYRPARYFLLSALIVVITAIVSAFVRLNIMPSNWFTEYGYMIGSILSMLLLSFALADRINLLKAETEKADQELWESEKKYRHIFENIQDVYYEATLNGTIIEISPSIERLSQYKRKELIGKPLSELYADPSERKKFNSEILKTGKTYDFEITLKDKDGCLHFISTNSLLLKDEQGKPLKIVGSIRDITERKSLEDQLLQLHKMESIGTLAGGIAHDFNNLLIVINGNAEMALMELGKGHSLYDYIRAILTAGEKAGFLTRQLLTFSRKQVIEPKILNINVVLSDLDKMLAHLIEEDIHIETILNSDLPKIKADPGQIEQILINLVVNARDAINQKMGKASEKKITIKTDQVYLDDSYVSDHFESNIGLHVVISVSDSGIGMDKELKRKIFEPFFTTKEKGKGTGLGLATVYGIVKQNNGSIEVYSEPKQGTTFKIYWPSFEEDISLEIKKNVNKDALVGSEKILLVEDDDEVRNFSGKALKKFGYQIHKAQNGVSALTLIKEKNVQIDLLVTDLIMPEMNGKELALELKKLFPEIKVLFASGYANNHIVHNGILEKGINFIHKPYSVIPLIKKVREVLDNG